MIGSRVTATKSHRSMQITDVRTVLLTGPCTLDPYLGQARRRRSAAFIEIHTDTSIVGLGETYAGYFCPELVPPIVDFFRPILLGQSVENVEQLWHRMFHCGNFWCRVGVGINVINGIEAALWDLKGKLEGKTVCELLGGAKHKQLKAYATGGPSNYPKEEMAAKVDFYQSLGFIGFKISAGAFWKGGNFEVSDDPAAAAAFEADKLEFLRRHAGDEVDIMLDGHMGNSPSKTWDLKVATAVVKAVEPYRLSFFEEPLPYTDPVGYAELRQVSKVAIAGGECLTGLCEWRRYIDQDCFDIGQPDASFTGGLTTFVKVSQLLTEKGRLMAAHAWGAGGSLMQNVHAGFACQNTLVLEVPPAYGPLHQEIIGDSFQMKNGYVLPPEKPGLGIELSERVKERFPFIPGSGEFNSVPGKILEEEQQR
jgi:galactonate dehydratase